MSFAARMIIALGLVLGLSANASVPDRQEFKDLLLGLSAKSQTGPLNCSEAYNGKTPVQVQYRFTVTDDPSYPDAFNLLFTNTVDSQQWSTLVAYEGYRGFVMGRLEVSRIDHESEFKHTFNGYFQDIVVVHTLDGVPNHLNYSKVGESGIYYELDCPLN